MTPQQHPARARFWLQSVLLPVCAFASLVAAAAVLTACGSSSDAKPRLEGQRVDVLTQRALLSPTPGADLEPFQLPTPLANENWSQTGGNAAHALQHVALPESVSRAWTRNLSSGSGKAERLLNPPVVNAGRLFTIDTSGDVVAVAAQSGKSLWRSKLNLREDDLAAFSGGLAVMGDLLFITTGSGQVFGLRASSGEEVWTVDLKVPLRAAPTAAGEQVFVISHDNRVFALSALTGALQWTHSGIEERLSILGGASPAVFGGLVVVPYSSGEIYVLDAASGRYLWHDALTAPMATDPFAGLADVVAAPVVADGLLYAVNVNGQLAAYNLQSGQRLWRVALSTSQTPWVSGSMLFVLTDEGQLIGLNRRDGSVRWATNLNAPLPASRGDAARYWSGPILAGNRLMVASSDGYALSLDPRNGSVLKMAELLRGDGVSVAPVAAHNGLYFLTDSGKVVAFR